MALPDPSVRDFPGATRNFDALVKALAAKANLASPTFTGDPKAPTAAPGDNDTSLATTAFVTAALAAAPAKVTTYPATVIAGTETTTSATYTTLTTHDEVTSVVLPANGLILIGYQALWKCTTASNGLAAVFIGATQLKVTQVNVTAPAVQETTNANTGTTDAALFSTPAGLSCVNANAGAQTQVTTGQIVGAVDGTKPAAGLIAVFAAAGTYTIAVKFKTAAGTLSVSSRKLWVEVHSYS